MASVPTGTKLGKYEVVKPLASGGMAELLLARTAPTERPLVLKWIRPEQAIDGTFVDTFVAEGRRAAQLHHPNIVEVHEVGREDGTHYLAMEYVHGDDLRKLLARLHERRAKLPVQHILAIATALAQALQHAHDQQDADGEPVLHLGIKPGNVIITSDGAVKLSDFGIGRAALTEGRTDMLTTIVGYLSPEQCTGQPVDRRSDIFGLGILMYELSIGRRLFKGDNEFVTMAAIVAGDVPLPTKHRGDLPKELEAVIMKALARAPEDRFQTAAELNTALEKFATKAGVRGSLTTLAGYTKRLFGVRPEPWLVEEEPAEPSSNDFDNSPKGLAVPPPEAAQSCRLPDYVHADDDSPIARVRKQVSRDLPTEQLNLQQLRGPLPERSAPVKIPAAVSTATTNGARSGAVRHAPPVPAAPTPASRNKPKSVQIPAAVADRIVKEESTRVMVQPPDPKEETTNVLDKKAEEKTNVLDKNNPFAADTVVEGPDHVLTPTTPIVPKTPPAPKPSKSALDRALTPGEEDTVDATTNPLNKPNGVNGARPRVVALAGLRDAAAKPAKRPDLPPPKPADEPRPRHEPPTRFPSEGTTATEIDDIIVESTAVAMPPPMPIVSTTPARELTEHVKPLPPARGTTTLSLELDRKKRKIMIAGAAVLAAVVVVIALVIGFGGDDVTPSASEQQLATDDEAAKKPDEPTSEEPTPASSSELRTSSAPRTPRNSHVTAGDETPTDTDPPKKEPKVEPEEAPVEVEAVKEAKIDELPPPPKFEEPRDPSPPDDERPLKEPKKPANQPKVATKTTKTTKPTPTKTTPTKPTPKTTPKTTTKPTTTTTKTKLPAKPKNWDPNSLFPTAKK